MLCEAGEHLAQPREPHTHMHTHFDRHMRGFSGEHTKTHTGHTGIFYIYISPTTFPSSICVPEYLKDKIQSITSHSRAPFLSIWTATTTCTQMRGSQPSPNSSFNADSPASVYWPWLHAVRSRNYLWLHRDDSGVTLYLPGLSCTNRQPVNNECGVNVSVGVCYFEKCVKKMRSNTGCRPVLCLLFIKRLQIKIEST